MTISNFTLHLSRNKNTSHRGRQDSNGKILVNNELEAERDETKKMTGKDETGNGCERETQTSGGLNTGKCERKKVAGEKLVIIHREALKGSEGTVEADKDNSLVHVGGHDKVDEVAAEDENDVENKINDVSVGSDDVMDDVIDLVENVLVFASLDPQVPLMLNAADQSISLDVSCTSA